jgi:parallel beta-helix repeat protein
MKQFLLCLLTIAFLTSPALATIRYVSPSGNDANSCAASSDRNAPKLTIASAVTCMSPGDTLSMRAGTYNEPIDTSGLTAGSAKNQYTFSGYARETVTITETIRGTYAADNSYYVFENFVLDGAGKAEGEYWTIANGSHDIILRNLEIKNWFGNGLYLEGSNLQIINCRVHDQRGANVGGSRYYGIYLAKGSNNLIEGNDVYNNPGGGIQLYPEPTNAIVRFNRIHDNNSLTTSSVGGIVVAGGLSVTGIQIDNNLVYNNGSSPAHGNSPGILVNISRGTRVWNNTVYGNQGYGIQLQETSGINAVVQNNIVYGNAYGEILDKGTNTTMDHNLTTDPKFINANALDFNIQARSPAIDAGESLSEVTTDFRRGRRPQGLSHDIGAFEVGASPLRPPTNLRVQ